MGWGERQRPFTERGRPVQGLDLKTTWKYFGRNQEIIQKSWNIMCQDGSSKKQLEGLQVWAGAGSWERQLGLHYYFSEFQGRVLFANLESCTIRMMGFLQSFSPDSSLQSIIFLENQGRVVPLLIPLTLFLEPRCPQGGIWQRWLGSHLTFTPMLTRSPALGPLLPWPPLDHWLTLNTKSRPRVFLRVYIGFR